MTTTIAKTWTIRCPDWCVQENLDGHQPAFDEDGRVCISHMGPDFGPFYGVGNQVDAVVTAAVVGDDAMPGEQTPAALRQFAADALAAAEWLETQS